MYMFTQFYVHVYLCIHILIHIYIYVYIHTYMYTYIYIYIYLCIQTHIYTYMYVFIYIYINICIYIYIYIYESDLCTRLVLFDTFCNMHKRLFFEYKRTAPSWIGPETHVKKHSKDYQQSMTILTLQHVCSRDKYATNPQRKPQKHSLCGKVQDNRTSVV